MKKCMVVCCFIVLLALTACAGEPKTNEQEVNVVEGKYYLQGDANEFFIEICEGDTIDFSHVDLDTILPMLTEDFSEDSATNEQYGETLKKCISTPYTYVVDNSNRQPEVRVPEFDGGAGTVVLKYNKDEAVLLWGEMEYKLDTK